MVKAVFDQYDSENEAPISSTHNRPMKSDLYTTIELFRSFRLQHRMERSIDPEYWRQRVWNRNQARLSQIIMTIRMTKIVTSLLQIIHEANSVYGHQRRLLKMSGVMVSTIRLLPIVNDRRR